MESVGKKWAVPKDDSDTNMLVTLLAVFNFANGWFRVIVVKRQKLMAMRKGTAVFILFVLLSDLMALQFEPPGCAGRYAEDG